MKLNPLHDRVLVRRRAAEAVTASGLHIPEKAQQVSFLADVLATGPGTTLEDGSVRPLDVQAGDVVLVGKYTGSALEDPDDLILRESDILAVVTETQRETES